MRAFVTSLFALTLCVPTTFAGGTTGKVLLDTWDIAHLGDGRAGYIHTIAKEVEIDGKKVIHTTVELRLTVKRFTDLISMSADTGTIETADGKVVGVFMKQFLGKKLQVQIDGVVVGKKIELTQDGKTPLNPVPWNPEVLGLYKQEKLFKDRELKAGEKFSFLSFEPQLNIVIKAEVVVKGDREVVLKGTKEKKKLLLVEVVPQKVEYKGTKIQLPVKQFWLDDKFDPIKTEVDIPGLGPIVTYRVTKAQALAPAPPASIDLGYSQLVRLKNRILKPHDTSAAVYRVTIRDDDDVATTFSRDDRQQVKNVRGNTFELHVKASGALEGKAEDKAAAEFTQSSYFINSDDAKVKELARKAVDKEKDAWKKALKIERWVHENMRFTNDEALATADHVARTLEGDCTEYAMLTAAMCRAEGVPSRTAIGLVYAEVKGAPCFGFHMWTEVWIKGRWIPIDAVQGKGHVGATHLKITDSSWHDERTLTPILPIIRVVSRVSIEVVSAENK